MREILFRGKRLDNGEWVYGDIAHRKSRFAPETLDTPIGIADEYGTFKLVDPATAGQFTGLLDKNGMKIFEGDVMEFDAYQCHYIGVVTTQDGNTDIRCKDASPLLDDAVKKHSAVVIGNPHDNPELLGGAE